MGGVRGDVPLPGKLGGFPLLEKFGAQEERTGTV